MANAFPMNFDPRLRRANTGGTSATPVSAPAALSPEEQVAAFERAHPFAPSGSFTPQPAAPAVDAQGFPDALPASLVAASNDPYAGARGGGEAMAMEQMVTGGLYPAGGSPAPAPSGGAARGAGGGGDFGLEGDASGLSPVLSAALGLQQLRQQAVASDVMGNMGRAGALLSPNDSPEIRSNKLQYYDKRLGDVAASALDPSVPAPRAPGSPMYMGDRSPSQPGLMTRNGQTFAATAAGPMTALELARMSTEIPSMRASVGAPPPAATQASGNRGFSVQLAETAERLRNSSRQPRLRTLGVDSSGRPVEGIQDAQGNFSRITEPKEGRGTGLNQLYQERDAALAAGLMDRVARYDDAIATWNQPIGIDGQPVRAGTGSTGTPAAATGAPVPPGQPPRQLSQADQQALTWARTNPNDQRAKDIFKRLGVEK